MATNESENMELNQQVSEQGGGKGPEGDYEGVSYDDVVLSKDEYRELVNELAELKMRLKDTEDAGIIDEVPNKSTQRPKEAPATGPVVDLDRLPREQFGRLIVDTVLKQINETAIQPLAEMILTLSLKEDIKEVRAKYPDFDEYRDLIKQSALKNPNLSIEDHYILVKQRNPKPPKQQVEEANRPLRVISGERGVVSRQTVKENPTMTLSKAAEKAFQEVFKKTAE